MREGFSTAAKSVEPDRYRRVLSNYPPGITLVTATARGGAPVGMVIGSFTSISLGPPLVAFLSAHTSTTFPHIRDAGIFCVDVLAAEQEEVCRARRAAVMRSLQADPSAQAASGPERLLDTTHGLG